MSTAVSATPRWLLLGLTALSPWLYAAQPPAARAFLTVALLILGGLFALSLALERRWPRLPPAALLVAGPLLLLGWFMTLNARAAFHWVWFAFEECPRAFPGIPGSWDAATSFAAMSLATGLFAAMAVSADLAADPVWRRRFWTVLTANGIALLGFGILQKAAAAPTIFWRADAADFLYFPTFFATFLYHGNAAAFICMLIPLALGRAALSMTERRPLAQAWAIGAIIGIAAAYVNTARGGMILASVLILAAAVGIAHFSGRLPQARAYRREIIYALVGFIVLAGALVLLSPETFKRWTDTVRWLSHGDLDAVSSGRLQVFRACAATLPTAGLFGFGPGTFEMTFPFFAYSLPATTGGIWRYAHQDYLQTLMEWGWLGTGLWALLFVGGFATVLRRIRRAPRPDQIWGVACLGALAAVLAYATFDFPLQVPAIQLLTAVLLGLAWGYAAGTTPDSGPAPQRHRSRQTALRCLAAIGLFAFAWPAQAAGSDSALIADTLARIRTNIRSAPACTAAAAREIKDESGVSTLLIASLALQGHTAEATRDTAAAVALARPELADAIVAACLVNAPSFIARENVFAAMRTALLNAGTRPSFAPVSPAGPAAKPNPAFIQGWLVAP